MLTVASIGILSSVALPAYQQYSNRARFSEALLATSVYQNAIVVAANAQQFTVITDVDEGQAGIPQPQIRDANTHGINVLMAKSPWYGTMILLSTATYTHRAGYHSPIGWTEGGTCLFNASASNFFSWCLATLG